MIIPTNTFVISLLVSISSVFGCGVIPGGQTSTRTFIASGPSNLPIIAVYTQNSAVSAIVPGIATSKEAVQSLAQRFAMQTVVDVLEIEGRRALLPDFVISNILGQLQVNTTYEPLQCQFFRKPVEDQVAMESCIYVGSTVTGICPMMQRRGGGMMSEGCNAYRQQTLDPLRNSHDYEYHHGKLAGVDVAKCCGQSASIVKIGSVRCASVHSNGHCQLKLKVNCDIIETNVFYLIDVYCGSTLAIN
ncbi:hypothetical protein KIN20_028816 [Parelaphostrongylus tenuis]|uniref:Uncharacterized protein n=1 Tax=Parelaphostrongylus tenuis TaxID=148309 RepID=A0AAD5WF39_PARTN|nr:hypothetical protein KIN20_028816 [Parelaphostrongylus tenuis]